MPFFIFCNKNSIFRKTIVKELILWEVIKMGKRKKIILLISLTTIVFLLTSCKYDKVEDNENKSVNVEKQDKESMDILDRSEDISDLIVDLIGIENATSIVFQDSVLIGIKFYDENDVGLTKDLKNSIEKLVLENDEKIKKVLITDDEKIFNNIEEIIQDLMRGEHIKNYTNQLNRILQKIHVE